MKLKPRDKKTLQDLQHTILLEASFMTMDKLKEHMKEGREYINEFCDELKAKDSIFDYRVYCEYDKRESIIDIYIKVDEYSEYVLYSGEMRGKPS